MERYTLRKPYRVTKETKIPNSGSLKLIGDIAELIKPDLLELSDWFAAYAKNQKSRIAFDLDFVQSHIKKNDKVLEFGSIPLLLTAALQKLGNDVSGVDIAPERFQSAINHLNIIVRKCDIESEKLPFSDASFDVILFFEIFEHLRINPIFTIKEVLRVIRPGGLLLVSTPNLKSIDGIINFLFRNKSYSCCGDIYEEYDKLQTIGHMGHVREYTEYEMFHFLDKVGFKVIEVNYSGMLYSSWKWKQLAIKFFPRLKPMMMIVARKK